MMSAEERRRATRVAIGIAHGAELKDIESRLSAAADACHRQCQFTPDELRSGTGIIWYLEQKGYKVRWCSSPDRWLVCWD